MQRRMSARPDEITTDPPEPGGRETFAYEQSPRPAGFPVAFRLRGKTLEVERMGRTDRVPLDAVTSVRLSYAPRSFAPGQLEAKLTLQGGRSVAITSVSFRSMFEARRQDAQYGRFVRELLRRVAKFSPKARFDGGRPWPIWVVLAIVSVLIVAALVVFAWQVWSVGEPVIAGVSAVMAVVGIWQLEPMVRLNKPRSVDPADPPTTLVPPA